MENTEEIVLCAASAYEQKFYLNPDFMTLPESVRQELQIMCVSNLTKLEAFLKLKNCRIQKENYLNHWNCTIESNILEKTLIWMMSKIQKNRLRGTI